MATQICPNCKKDSFTWSIDEDSSLTRWCCHDCYYEAFENESLERECLSCHKMTEMYLQDTAKKYWWCCNCNNIKEIKKE